MPCSVAGPVVWPLASRGQIPRPAVVGVRGRGLPGEDAVLRAAHAQQLGADRLGAAGLRHVERLERHGAGERDPRRGRAAAGGHERRRGHDAQASDDESGRPFNSSPRPSSRRCRRRRRAAGRGRRRRTSPRARARRRPSTSASGTSSRSSSCTCSTSRAPRPSARSRSWMRIIATLMMSAFEPCMTKFTASRSPSERVARFDARISGTGRRRPSSDVT